MRKLAAALLMAGLVVFIRPAQALLFYGSEQVVDPGAAGAQVSVGLLVQDIVDFHSLTADVSFTSGYLQFDPAHLNLNAGIYQITPDNGVVLGSLTTGFSPLLGTATPANTMLLSASLSANVPAVSGSGSLLYIPLLVSPNTPDGDYFVSFTCTQYTYLDQSGAEKTDCTDLLFPETKAKITVQRGQQTIPEPSTLGLLGLGLGLLISAAARSNGK